MNNENTTDDMEPQEWLVGNSPVSFSEPRSHSPRYLLKIAVLLGGLALICLLITRVNAQALQRNEWLCAVSNSTAVGQTAVWDSAAYNWKNVPDDLVPFADVLYADPDLSSAYSLWISLSAQQIWIIPIADLNTVSTDAKGQHEGQHDLCSVHIYPFPKDRP